MRRAFILSCVALVALAGLNLWMWHKFTLERDNSALLRAALADAQRTIPPRPLPETGSAHRARPVMGLLAVSTPAQPAPEAAPPASGENIVKKWQDRERQMLDDSEYRDAWRRSAHDQLAPLRADALRVVGMTPEQADHVLDLWVDRNLWFQQHGDLTGRGSMSAEATAELTRRSDAEQAEVRALLGEQKYAAWAEYLRTQGERAEANFLSRQLSTVSEALEPAQIDALVVALSAERGAAEATYRGYRQANGATDPFANQTREDRERYVDLVRAANRNVHDRMAGTLNAAQLEKLDSMLTSRLLPIEAQLRLEAKASP